jgi:hypothetical protein
MVVARITCPQCGNTLTVSENAPPRVSCPRCLAPLLNPASPASGVRPVPVLPLDSQVERDTRFGRWLSFGLVGLLAIAAAFTFAGGNTSSGVFVMLMAGGLATFLYFFGEIRGDKAPRRGATEATSESGPAPSPLPDVTGPSMLQYRTAGGADRPRATAGAVAAGFFSAIGVCAVGFLILLATAETSSIRAHASHNALYLAGVVVLVIAFIIASVNISWRWRGFAPGAIAGLCLGMLALGPCAACYLMTLG